MPDFDEIIEEQAAEPAEATIDGQTAKNRPLTEILDARDRTETASTLTGTNPNGGKKSAWGQVRMARMKPPGAGPC